MSPDFEDQTPSGAGAYEGASPGEPTEESTDRVRVSPTRKPVLVVEDDPTHRDFLLGLLGEWGYEPLVSGSAEEAEQVISGEPIEAAIIDIFLPGRSGAALMSRLRTRFPDAMLIGISALGDAATARRCKGLGADLFLQKPIAPEVLAEALQTEHHAWH